MKTSKLSGLRKPFVVTIAAAATALSSAGCSSENAGGPGGDGGTAPQPTCSKDIEAGTACAVEGDSCSWDDCGGYDTHQASCTGGIWQVSILSCNPPPPQACPAERPTEGEACDPYVVGFGECGYGDCFGRQTDFASCVEGAWSIYRTTCNPPPPPVCPSEAPALGSSCLNEGDSCNYGDCFGIPTKTAACTSGQWEVYELSCNPPPPPGEGWDGGLAP